MTGGCDRGFHFNTIDIRIYSIYIPWLHPINIPAMGFPTEGCYINYVFIIRLPCIYNFQKKRKYINRNILNINGVSIKRKISIYCHVYFPYMLYLYCHHFTIIYHGKGNIKFSYMVYYHHIPSYIMKCAAILSGYWCNFIDVVNIIVYHQYKW